MKNTETSVTLVGGRFDGDTHQVHPKSDSIVAFTRGAAVTHKYVAKLDEDGEPVRCQLGYRVFEYERLAKAKGDGG